MNNNIKTKDIDVVILCGGKGKRLQPIVNDRPKPMAKIGGRPFLDILIDYVARFAFRRFILCVGYRGDFIRKYYRNKEIPFTILFSKEESPLGTAGAIKNAEPLIKSNPFLVMNGDSICRIDLNEYINFHIKKKALFSMALSDIQTTDDCGKVTLNKSGRITAFNEKIRTELKENFTNVGIYLLNKSIFSEIPKNKKCSIEYEIFPSIVNRRFYGFITQEWLMDIGTPERFMRAKNRIKEIITR